VQTSKISNCSKLATDNGRFVNCDLPRIIPANI